MWHANTTVHDGSKTSKTSPTTALFLLSLPCDLHVGPIWKVISYLQPCREVLSPSREGKNPFHPLGSGTQNPSRPWFNGACDWFRCHCLQTRAPTGHATIPRWHATTGTREISRFRETPMRLCWRWKSINLVISLPLVLAWLLYLIHWY
jgi:hypothetical protein